MRKLQFFFIIVISIIAFILLIAVASTLQQAAGLGSGGTVSIFAIEPSAQTQTALLWASGASILDTVALCYLHISCHSKVDYQAWIQYQSQRFNLIDTYVTNIIYLHPKSNKQERVEWIIPVAANMTSQQWAIVTRSLQIRRHDLCSTILASILSWHYYDKT